MKTPVIGSPALITLVVMVCSPIIQLLINTVISPEYFQNAIAYSVEYGGQTQEQAESFFNLQNYLIMGTLSAPIMGAITAAIMALVVRRSAQPA